MAAPATFAVIDGSVGRDCLPVNMNANTVVTVNTLSGGLVLAGRGVYVEGGGTLVFTPVGFSGSAAPARTVVLGNQTLWPCSVVSIDTANSNCTGVHILI